ncbi:hypothetical protein A6X21_12840 [Planctopirus hydrillae]|uniref:Uncharacterized protein n=1 Tax=Planctopirus hydrillae TaxID=1841610 RepID=A0A1C3E5P5_9PLAN|nr:hypothetical protein A6X21_12840 [Planctopirus hydrillae]
MFRAIMMRRNVTGAVILANGDDQMADEDIRPLPPRREGMLAQSCKHGTKRYRIEQRWKTLTLPSPTQTWARVSEGHAHGAASCRCVEHNDPATSWPGHPCPAIVDHGQITAASMAHKVKQNLGMRIIL